MQAQPMRRPNANGGNGAFFIQHQISNPVHQAEYLDHEASVEIPKAEITEQELQEKEAFRKHLEAVCHKAFIDKYTGDIASIKLVMFGSLASGFATPGSDMDLAIVPEWKDPSKSPDSRIGRDIPRLLERAVLDAKLGGRLLTRTRVPILKVCQTPTEELYNALFEERQKWDELPEEEKYPPPGATAPALRSPSKLDDNFDKAKSPTMNNSLDLPTPHEAKLAGKSPRPKPATTVKIEKHTEDSKTEVPKPPTTNDTEKTGDAAEASKDRHPRAPRQWQRERKQGPLDFPKSGVGIQCDVNFENPLAIHNTQLLRCYSLTDPRVRPMVLFVKAWAKRRKINSAYSGTLSSYGWVLMVLHYLVNIAHPPVCPNLQSSWRPTTTKAEHLQQLLQETTVGEYTVRFWHDEAQITHLARTGQLTHNKQSIGDLLRGFFMYFASIAQSNAYGQRQWCFYWATEVLSLRTPGGIRRKDEKGWTRATTTTDANGKEVRQRYLFSIEDPFELDHNVARTVTHDGIVAIRDELRRAGRILNDIGRGIMPEGFLFDEVVEPAPPPTPPPALGKAEGETDAVADGAVSNGQDAGKGSGLLTPVTNIPAVAGGLESQAVSQMKDIDQKLEQTTLSST